LRLFLAVELPVDIREQLAGLCYGLKNVRWVEPHNLHLTLAFLGDVEAHGAADMHAALSDIEFDPFDLSLAEVDCFDSKGKVYALWAGVQGDRVALCHLQHKIMNTLARAGLEPERRKYKPHVTLSRLRNVPRTKVMDYMAAHNDFRSPSFRVGHVTLYQSHLTHNGAQYEVLERYGPEADFIDKN